MHVHVAVGGADKALQIMEALPAELPLLLALSASSPFLDGEETGLASTRLIVLQAMPRTGLPPVLENWREFVATLAGLRRAGAIADAWALERVESITAVGTSADRQLRLVRRGHRLADVLRGLVEETTRA
jgi:gamma-glutamyl:cysteine ligase YbdK (ATP-grasp superfamily)